MRIRSIPTSMKFAATALFVLMGTAPVVGQSVFSSTIQVNQSAITPFELDQRVRLLRTFRTAGDLEAQAREGLIDERLMAEEARKVGLEITEETLQEEINGYFERGGVTEDEFRDGLATNGIDWLTFVDYAEIRALWREYVRGRFLAQIAVSEDEVDRALSLSGGGLRVLIRELVLAADESNRQRARTIASELRENIRSPREFSEAARRYSAAASRDDDGNLDWLDAGTLSSTISTALVTMSPGDISQPLDIANAVVLVQLRDLGEGRRVRRDTAAIEYMQLRLPNAGSAATDARIQDILGQTDTCNDFWAAGDGLDPNALTRQSLPPASIPADVRAVLATLDDNEMSTGQSNGEARVVMLCGRSPVLSDDLSRDDVMRDLRNQRIEQLADSHLAELRSAAQIIEK